jgi:hypothetical protein
VAFLVCWPVAGAYADEEGDLPGDVDTTCAEVFENDGDWEVAMATDPADGATVMAGETVTAVVTWPVEDFAADAPLYATLACVTVDGSIDEALTDEDLAAANDGEFTPSFTVPDGLEPGTEICARAAVVGDGNGYWERNKSNDVCFTVAESSSSQLATLVPPAPDVVPATEVLGVTDEQPAPAPVPEVAPLALEELPRTGPASGLAALAGLLLILGGAATGCTPRRRPTAR